VTASHEIIRPVYWRNAKLFLLDQRVLPHQELWLSYDHPHDVADAIKDMVVRGAPAIGVTAAYGVVLAARQAWEVAGANWKQAMTAPVARLEAARPTAVNLMWAIKKMAALYRDLPDGESPEARLLELAQQIHDEDVLANHAMGKLGAALIAPGSTVMTHCNAGALATGGYGTALGVIRHAYAEGLIEHVYVDETRPWMQGSRLTAWELMQENIPATLQVESAVGTLMASRKLSWVIVGADRIAANGDVANKIGTYNLAVLARYHGVKMMVVAPLSTIDWDLQDGSTIPIEQRPGDEVTFLAGQSLAPEGIKVANPAFDVTPASLIDAIVTEAGVVLKPSIDTMQAIKTET
jgi:methylthioribose-1-phosphate isomerase